MGTRKLLIIAALVLTTSARPARAEFGLGLFIGDPTGIDFKFDIARKSAIDILIGWPGEFDDDYHTDGGYAHVTYLVQPLVTHGSSVIVPLRLGIGAAIYDHSSRFSDHLHLGIRVPFEVGLRFRRTPLEIYFSIALELLAFDSDDHGHDRVDIGGGIGLRFYL